MNPESKNKTRKLIAITLVLVELQTQVVFAGVPVWMGTPPGVAQIAKKALTIFHAFPQGDSLQIDPRGHTDYPQESQTSPEGVIQQEKNQMDILRQMEDLEIFHQETFSNRPQLPGSEANILDTLSTYRLNTNVAKELRLVHEELTRKQESYDQDIENLRKAVKGAGGSMTIERDGGRYYTIHGLLAAIIGQRLLDGNNQITVVDTRRIKYNKDTRLQTGYTRVSTDSQGNVTTTIRSDETYTPDSNEHGKQLVTGYHEIDVDADGNISTVDRRNITYWDTGNIK